MTELYGYDGNMEWGIEPIWYDTWVCPEMGLGVPEKKAIWFHCNQSYLKITHKTMVGWLTKSTPKKYAREHVLGPHSFSTGVARVTDFRATLINKRAPINVEPWLLLPLCFEATGWWARATPLKNMSSSIGMIRNPIFLGKCQKWQPNHQPARQSRQQCAGRPSHYMQKIFRPFRSLEVIKAKMNYQWATFHCHVWVLQSRFAITHPQNHLKNHGGCKNDRWRWHCSHCHSMP